MLWAKANNLGNLSFAELCANKKVEAMILKDLAAVAKENQLPGFEQAKHIHLTPEMFTAENGLLTPTFKSKRNELKAHFQKEIKELYSRL